MDKSKELVRIFVYGTLKPGEVNYQRYCAGKVVEAKRAIAFGQLFALPLGYPAMTPGNSPIQGFLLSFSHPDILRTLDWLEDYDQHRAASENEYERQPIKVYNLTLELLGLAWVYLMTPKRVKQLDGVFLPDGWWSGYNLFSARSLEPDPGN